MIKIYHAKEMFVSFRDKEYPAFPDDYDLVAIVDTDDLEIAFRDTNHIDCEWWENSNVTLIKKSRSTSVGDVAVEVRGDYSQISICSSVGWDLIGELYHYSSEFRSLKKEVLG